MWPNLSVPNQKILWNKLKMKGGKSNWQPLFSISHLMKDNRNMKLFGNGLSVRCTWWYQKILTTSITLFIICGLMDTNDRVQAIFKDLCRIKENATLFIAFLFYSVANWRPWGVQNKGAVHFNTVLCSETHSLSIIMCCVRLFPHVGNKLSLNRLSLN